MTLQLEDLDSKVILLNGAVCITQKLDVRGAVTYATILEESLEFNHCTRHQWEKDERIYIEDEDLKDNQITILCSINDLVSSLHKMID